VRFAPDKWTIKDVVAHIVDDERIFAFRALSVARGETQPLPGFDEKTYAANARGESRAWMEVLSEYQAVREATLALLSVARCGELDALGRGEWVSDDGAGVGVSHRGHELHHVRLLRERYLPCPRD
jgi:hypothetical protein